MKKTDGRTLAIKLIILTFLILQFNIIGVIIFFVALITYKLSVRKYKKKNLKHKKFDIKYFRDDLRKLSPAYISYVVNYDIEMNKDVCAHVLKLYIDKYIDIVNDKFKVTKKDQSKLNESDKLLLEYVNGNFRDPNFYGNYKKAIKNELVLDGYIVDSVTKKDILGLFSSIAISIIGIDIMMYIKNPNNLPSYLKVIITIAIIFFIITIAFAPVIFVTKLIALRNHGMTKRTKKGEELLEQIYGLKAFLKDFSIIDKKDVKDVYLSEHYMVYAITLGVNDKADDEILKKIKKQIRF